MEQTEQSPQKIGSIETVQQALYIFQGQLIWENDLKAEKEFTMNLNPSSLNVFTFDLFEKVIPLSRAVKFPLIIGSSTFSGLIIEGNIRYCCSYL